MNCPNKELLMERAAGRLEAEAAAALDAHLAGCSECRAWMAGQAEVWEALDGWQPAPVSADFDDRLYARLDAAAPRRWRSFRLRPALSLALAAMLVIAVVLLERPKTPPAPSPRPPAARQVLDPDRLERALDDVEMLRQMM